MFVSQFFKSHRASKEPLEIISPVPLLKLVHYSRWHRKASGWVLKISRKSNSTTSLGSQFQGSGTLTVKKVLPHVFLEISLLQFVPIFPCPVSGHY